MTSATNASATAKWAVTHHGFSSVCDHDAAEDRLAEHQRERGRGRPHERRDVAGVAATRPRPVATTSTDDEEHQEPVRELDQGMHGAGREELSGRALRPAWSSRAPSPVPRTRPPTANSTMVAAAVASASFWKRVIGVGDARAMIVRRRTRAALAILTAHGRRPEPPHDSDALDALRERGSTRRSARSWPRSRSEMAGDRARRAAPGRRGRSG